jgi:hypothetical protein
MRGVASEQVQVQVQSDAPRDPRVIRPLINWYRMVFILPSPTEHPSSSQLDKVYICDRCNAVIAAPIRGKFGFPTCDLGHNVVERRSFFNRFRIGVVLGVCAYLSRYVIGGLFPSTLLGKDLILWVSCFFGLACVIGSVRVARKPLPQKELAPGQLGTGIGILAGLIFMFLVDIARLRFLR